MPEALDIAAGTVGLLPTTLDKDEIDPVIPPPGLEDLNEVGHHSFGERIERLGPVEHKAAVTAVTTATRSWSGQ